MAHLDEEQHYERLDMDADFEDGEFINGEFFHRGKRQRKQQTKEEQLYGVFAEDSGARPSPSRSRSSSQLPGCLASLPHLPGWLSRCFSAWLAAWLIGWFVLAVEAAVSMLVLLAAGCGCGCTGSSA